MELIDSLAVFMISSVGDATRVHHADIRHFVECGTLMTAQQKLFAESATLGKV
jgi:hypothetical protein